MAIQIDNISLGSITIAGTPPTYIIYPVALTVDEGSSLTINILADGVFSGTTLYWKINNITTSDSDFSAVSGSFTITNFAGSFTISPLADLASEGEETFTVSVRTGSTSGTVVATSDTITIVDTSITPGQIAYTTPGTYTWTAPTGVSVVSVIAVGGGGSGARTSTAPAVNAGGGGGGLGWKNSITVTPGASYTVVVGAGGDTSFAVAQPGGDSYFIDTTTVRGQGGRGAGASAVRGTNASGGAGGTYVGDGGGTGGAGGGGYWPSNTGSTTMAEGGGGGAGGYSGTGGRGGYRNPPDTGTTTSPLAGAGGGGGGGSFGYGYNISAQAGGGSGGGGVGILGSGSNGAAGGGGGSGGSDAPPRLSGPGNNGDGATYGGGGGGGDSLVSFNGVGGRGAVRIIWPGNLRQFPSTRTADE